MNTINIKHNPNPKKNYLNCLGLSVEGNNILNKIAKGYKNINKIFLIFCFGN